LLEEWPGVVKLLDLGVGLNEVIESYDLEVVLDLTSAIYEGGYHSVPYVVFDCPYDFWLSRDVDLPMARNADELVRLVTTFNERHSYWTEQYQKMVDALN
jgi:hypothetical protein